MTGIVKGYKFLKPNGTTVFRGKVTLYPLPEGDGWGAWFPHPDPAEPDGKDCGPGGWHMKRHVDSRYAPGRWILWRAEGRGVLGESDEKMRVREIRLRRVRPGALERWARAGHGAGAWLAGVDLRGVDLRGADLEGAVLTNANLENAKLEAANLRLTRMRHADLTAADMRGADLQHADLQHADLVEVDLAGADLRCAELWLADLTGATLEGARLTNADLAGAIGLQL